MALIGPEKTTRSTNVIKLRETGLHRNVEFGFFVTISKKHLTNAEKCAAFLLTEVSKNAILMIGVAVQN